MMEINELSCPILKTGNSGKPRVGPQPKQLWVIRSSKPRVLNSLFFIYALLIDQRFEGKMVCKALELINLMRI